MTLGKDRYWPNWEGFQCYAEAFHSTWTDQPDAAKLLAAVAADQNRGTYRNSRNQFVSVSHRAKTHLMNFRKTISERFPAAHLSLSQVCQELSVERFPAVSQCWTYAFAATILVAG